VEAEPGIFCFDVFDVGDDLLALLVCSPDDVSWFRLSIVFVIDLTNEGSSDDDEEL